MARQIVILGAGTGGTLTANRLRKALKGEDIEITVVDKDDRHIYQPGLLFVPFGLTHPEDIVRPRQKQLHKGIRYVQSPIDRVELEADTVHLGDGTALPYDVLVIATGVELLPDETEGLTGPGWMENVFTFYSIEGAAALEGALATFDGGKVVVNVVDMPIKCPVAPLEFLFLADAYFTERKMRDRVELVYATPLDGAFTKPLAAKVLGHLLDEKRIKLETEFSTASVDGARRALVSFDEREVPYDMLVSIPTHSGAGFIEKSGIGNELAFVPTDKRTLAAKGLENVFVIGDATDVPTSKAGSVAHFQADSLEENIVRATRGLEPLPSFDGHANCFVETGHGKALLIDFNYDVDPLPGDYPVPGVGPFSLLAESRMNHIGKVAFRWMYWNGILHGRPMPVPSHMSMAGKHVAA